MNENRRNWITWAFIAATLLVVVFMLLETMQRPTRIQLPVTDTVSEESTDESGSDRLTVISVTPGTVQAVIGSLERPEAYRRTVTMEQIWSGGSGTAEVDVTVRGGWTRTDRVMPGGQTRHTLTDGEITHIWYNSGEEIYTGPAGEVTADMEQGIPTYEDILALSVGDIVSADYRVLSDVNCIYVETAPDEDGYVLRYWVNVDSGLLTAAEKLSDGSAVYRMAALAQDTALPAEELFVLPDGRALLSETE